MNRLLIGALTMFCIETSAKEVSDPEVTLLEGNTAIENAEFEIALSSCKQGIAELGETYCDANVLDDTGQKLVLASISEEEGLIERAAYITCRVFSSRVSIMKSQTKSNDR